MDRHTETEREKWCGLYTSYINACIHAYIIIHREQDVVATWAALLHAYRVEHRASRAALAPQHTQDGHRHAHAH
jgi:hypothetical protein